VPVGVDHLLLSAARGVRKRFQTCTSVKAEYALKPPLVYSQRGRPNAGSRDIHAGLSGIPVRAAWPVVKTVITVSSRTTGISAADGLRDIDASPLVSAI
jgi:hypothetical protein